MSQILIEMQKLEKKNVSTFIPFRVITSLLLKRILPLGEIYFENQLIQLRENASKNYLEQ
jgi:hypothetical protein